MFSTNTGNLIWTLLVFAGFIFSVCLHEFGHAIVAYWGGDRSVKEKGYLTLNPLKYTHPTYSIVMPFIFVLLGGIPLPGAAVYINKGALKGTGWRSAVSAAGPLATLIVAIAIAVAISFFPAPTDLAQLSLDVSEPQALLFQCLALLLTLEVAGVFLNLIPVPGLDGYGIIEPWLPIRWQRKLRRYANYGVWFLFAVFFFVPSFSQLKQQEPHAIIKDLA
jgi:Zn-dependent protease